MGGSLGESGGEEHGCYGGRREDFGVYAWGWGVGGCWGGEEGGGEED